MGRTMMRGGLLVLAAAAAILRNLNTPLSHGNTSGSLSLQEAEGTLATTQTVTISVLPLFASNASTMATTTTIPTMASTTGTIDNEEEEEEEPRVAIYMTTHVSKEHRKFLKHCWPAAVQQLPLLQKADLIVYTSASKNETDDDQLFGDLGFRNVTVRRYSIHAYHEGAIMAMVDPFLPENQHWFEPYQWIVRLNRDVLIRRDQWLRDTMKNATVDAIMLSMHVWDGDVIFTDFYAFRPGAVNGTALINEYREQKKKVQNGKGKCWAEGHIGSGFRHLQRSGRVAQLPGAKKKGRSLRIVGTDSDVIHYHPLVRHCPNYFNATNGEIF